MVQPNYLVARESMTASMNVATYCHNDIEIVIKLTDMYDEPNKLNLLNMFEHMNGNIAINL